MGRNEDGAEILVHITAPSAAADDAKYRALAQAYLDFQPKGIIGLPADPSSKREAVPSEKFISPQASFGSVWDNVGSPRLAGVNQHLAPSAGAQHSIPPASSQLRDDSQLSWIAPPSEVPDSMPDNDIRAPAFNTPTRVLKYFLQATEQASLSSGGASAEVPEGGRNAAHGDASQAGTLDGLLDRGAGLDSSPSTRRLRSHAPQVPDPIETVRNVHDVTGDYDEGKAPSASRSTAEPEAHRATIPDTLPHDKSAYAVDNSDWAHETQLISTEPAVANHRLGPRAPQHLEKLAESMQMGKKYRPKYQARDMRPFERGYWLMRLDGWEFEEKVKAWGFLGNYIRRDDKAGWGTRACRDESWDWIRLYGWEHIAGELYILLYVASYRKLKFMEIKYYDAAGDVLIVVGPRGSQPKPGQVG